MERLIAPETEDTRLTQQELELVLNRWREEKDNTVSVADVAEALHCSKAEIEALVWRARAEGVTAKPGTKRKQITFHGMMLWFLPTSMLMFVFGNLAGGANSGSGFFGVGGVLLVSWAIYATFFVLAESWNRRP